MQASLRHQRLHFATDLAELRARPPGSLGHRYALWFAADGGQPLPDPVLQPGTAGDDAWLHQRVRHTHDLWHVGWPAVRPAPPARRP